VDFMFFKRVGVDQEVVEVGCKELVEVVAERIVYEVLEGARGVTEAERHHLVLKQAIATAKCRLPFFTLSHPEEVIAISHVQFGEVFCAGQTLQQFPNEWEGVAVLDGDFVQSAVVHTES